MANFFKSFAIVGACQTADMIAQHDGIMTRELKMAVLFITLVAK